MPIISDLIWPHQLVNGLGKSSAKRHQVGKSGLGNHGDMTWSDDIFNFPNQDDDGINPRISKSGIDITVQWIMDKRWSTNWWSPVRAWWCCWLLKNDWQLSISKYQCSYYTTGQYIVDKDHWRMSLWCQMSYDHRRRFQSQGTPQVIHFLK